MTEQQEELYQCVGICMADPDSGYCLGCGRPPMSAPDVIAELVVPTATHATNRDGSPEKPE